MLFCNLFYFFPSTRYKKIYIYILSKVFFSPMEGIIQCGHLKLNYRCHCYLFLQKWLVPGHLTILQYIFLNYKFEKFSSLFYFLITHCTILSTFNYYLFILIYVCKLYFFCIQGHELLMSY